MKKNIIQPGGEGKPFVVVDENTRIATGNEVEINGPGRVFLWEGKLVIETEATVTVINGTTKAKETIL